MITFVWEKANGWVLSFRKELYFILQEEFHFKKHLSTLETLLH